MISPEWLSALQLEERHSPEFIRTEDSLNDIPHGSAIRQSFNQLGLSAIHCVSGVPTIAFLVQESFEQDSVDEIHKALWNQGLASLLAVITGDTLRVYSLSQLPVDNFSDTQSTERLVATLNLTIDALELKNLVLGVESGRFIAANEDKFDASNRIDQVLLSNLEATINKLVTSGLTIDSAQALLMQVMFIAYLEDKKIIDADYFVKATCNSKITSLLQLLNDGRVDKFTQLFKLLKLHFNGDLFIAPCSFDEKEKHIKLKEEHVNILAEFRSGNLNLVSKQYQFWPYDFRYIPIELISAVYDRFLGFDPNAKRETGAYYTPMFLADLVVEQAWSELSDKQKIAGKYVDPSCGSGIFLVRLFDKMAEQWRSEHNNQLPSWPSLLTIIKRIYGFDIKKESVRVAAFSLYIALLEKARPSEILKLMEKGRLLPKLCGETLRVKDFFQVEADGEQYDLLIGNPPWVSKRGDQKQAIAWCDANNRVMPGKEIAWGFAWKALSHCKKDGMIALLLKATSFLTNHSTTFLSAREQWLNNVHLTRVINLADMRFQLFDDGNAPTALMVYKPLSGQQKNYRFEYWVPKADINLKTKRLLTLSSVDKANLPIQLVKEDPLLLKRRMWMQTPDAKLFQFLHKYPKLGEKIITHQKSKNDNNDKKWIIGQGFNPAQNHRIKEEGYKITSSRILTEIPHLDAAMFIPVVMPTIETKPWNTSNVYRRNFEAGYKAPHILVMQGISSIDGRLRASYCVQDLSFRHAIQAISFEKRDTRQAIFLTALLNSSLVAWFLFHHRSNTGMERPNVHQEQLLNIPYPPPHDLDNKRKAQSAFDDAVDLIERLLKQRDKLLQTDISGYMTEIDNIIYRYFDLDKAQIKIIEDALYHIIPSMQPRVKAKRVPSLWMDATYKDIKLYGEYLSKALTEWLNEPNRAVIELVGESFDLAVISVRISTDSATPAFQIKQNQDMEALLAKIWKVLPSKLSGNFQLIPDLRVFIDDVLYLIKPRKRRFWLGSTALADADAIASELLHQKFKE
ncbi:MAG: HsdM family class I SAM-dependent methyltransferase [Gammaproteobacteria bacterium]|jgi:hypothetical protein